MAKTRAPEKQTRNDVIYAEWLRGASLTALGAKYGLARQVVTRIVRTQYPEGAEDDDRSLFRGYMWRLYDEVQEIGDRPGFKMQPNGRPAEDPDGNPALDTNVQVQAKELQLKILRELRLLDGRDRQVPKGPPQDEAMRQMWAAIAVERERWASGQAKGATVPGEVVRELPPAQSP